MNTFEITGIRVERTTAGPHVHIARIRYGPLSHDVPASTIAKDLRDPNGDRYYTFAGGERADVVVKTCPDCTFRDYITTHAESTTKNDLLELPRF